MGLSSVVHEGGKRAESWRERCREFCGGGMGVGWGWDGERGKSS